MRAVIFDVDHTLFAADKKLHEGVSDLLAILNRLGCKLAALSSNDHRAIVRLDEAGVRHYFSHVLTAAQHDEPKTLAGLQHLLKELGAEAHEVVLVSHAHADILLAKEAQLAKVIGISHGTLQADPLREAGADRIVEDVPAVLDVLE